MTFLNSNPPPLQSRPAPLFLGIRRFGVGLIFAALAFCALINIDPGASWGRYPGAIALRYLPLLFSIAGFLTLASVGIPIALLRSPPIVMLLFLALLMFVGSSIALANGAMLHDTFLGRSLNILAILPGALIASQAGLNQRLSRQIIPLFYLTASAGLTVMLLHAFGISFLSYPHVLHEEAIFVVAALIWICRRHPSTLLRLAIILILTVLFFETQKSTLALLTIIFAGLTFGIDLQQFLWRARHRIKISPPLFWLLCALTTLTIAGLALYLATEVVTERSQRFEHDLRLRMWQTRWTQFTDSPILGSLFTGSPLFFEPLLSDLKLPTHNDPLDLLAGGGGVAFSLYLGAMLIIWVGPLKTIISQNHAGQTGADRYYWILSACCGVSALGNPVLNEPRIAVPVFFALGHVAMSHWLCKLPSGKS